MCLTLPGTFRRSWSRCSRCWWCSWRGPDSAAEQSCSPAWPTGRTQADPQLGPELPNQQIIEPETAWESLEMETTGMSYFIIFFINSDKIFFQIKSCYISARHLVNTILNFEDYRITAPLFKHKVWIVGKFKESV